MQRRYAAAVVVAVPWCATAMVAALIAVVVTACGGGAAAPAPALPASETAAVSQAPDAGADPNVAIDLADAKNCYFDPAEPASYACFGSDGALLAAARDGVFACARETKILPPSTLIATRTATSEGTAWSEVVFRGDEAMVACLRRADTWQHFTPLLNVPTVAPTPGTTLTTVIRLRRRD